MVYLVFVILDRNQVILEVHATYIVSFERFKVLSGHNELKS
jgi:hypothetical protein